MNFDHDFAEFEHIVEQHARSSSGADDEAAQTENGLRLAEEERNIARAWQLFQGIPSLVF